MANWEYVHNGKTCYHETNNDQTLTTLNTTASYDPQTFFYDDFPADNRINIIINDVYPNNMTAKDEEKQKKEERREIFKMFLILSIFCPIALPAYFLFRIIGVI